MRAFSWLMTLAHLMDGGLDLSDAAKWLPECIEGDSFGTPEECSPLPPLSSSVPTPKGSLETTARLHSGHIVSDRYGPADYYDFPPPAPGESKYRHGRFSAARRRIYESMLRTGASCRRVANFADCGNSLIAKRDGTEYVLVCNKCHDRNCDACQKERQAKVVEAVLLKCADSHEHLRFVTLTLRHSDTPLSVQIDRLYSSFKLLRQHPEMKSAMIGGVWFFEGKLDAVGQRWHPHLHCIIEGFHIPQKTLARVWHEVTGDSYYVDIRIIDDPAKRARYASKYATKPLHPGVIANPAKLDEFMVAIKGRRLYQCFGTWAKAVAREKTEPRKLETLGHVSVIHTDALAGNADAIFHMRNLHGRFPRLRTAFPLPDHIEPREPDLP